jgi:5'-nucleotidase
MKSDLERDLVVGVSSRALFDLRAEDEIFRACGLEEYCEHQVAHENEILQPGTGFHLVRLLLRLNDLAHAGKRILVIVMSRNNADTSLRIFNSIDAHNLDISRGALTSGEPIAPYIKAFQVDLFLSAEESDVCAAAEAGCAAALIYEGPTAADLEHERLQIAFDGDAVLFSEESELIYQERGLEAFVQHEQENAQRPLPDGPFARLFRDLASIQATLGPDKQFIRTALVTARNSPAHERVVRTFRAWGVRVDEAFFLGGLPKQEILAAFRPHIFFDDHRSHCDAASQVVPTARVPSKARPGKTGRAA